jgi:ABC-type multidrug transport system fused ATPase/permease subunit
MRIEKTGVEALSPEENVRLVSLAFKLVAARDPLGLVEDNLQQRILQARQVFAENLPRELKGSVEFFDPDRYYAAAPVQQNVLFGTITLGEASNRERVHDAITEVLDELGLRRTLVELGLHFPVGTGRSRLSEAQRRKVAIATAVLKGPDIIAFSDATAVIDSETEATILQRLKQQLASCSLVCSLHRTRLASAFDRILVMEQGRLVDQGRFAELQKPGSALAPLVAAD